MFQQAPAANPDPGFTGVDQFAGIQTAPQPAAGGGWQSAEPREYIDDATRQQMIERTDWGEMLDSPPPHNE